MEAICLRYPDVGWRLCLAQFGTHHQIGHYNSRPHWRNDATGAGQPVKTWNESWPVSDKARTLALNWPIHTAGTLGDLVERVRDMPETDQDAVWSLVRGWATSSDDDMAKCALREHVRKSAFTRYARSHGSTATANGRVREAYSLLAPNDLVTRHLWLFAQHWVDESGEEMEAEEFDFHKREARVSALRKAALGEIWHDAGYDGVMRLCALGDASSVIGRHLADGVIAPTLWQDSLDRMAGEGTLGAELKVDNLIAGFLGCLDVETRRKMINALIKGYTETNAADKAIRVLKCAPFRAETWTHLDVFPEEWRRRYWSEAYVRWEGQNESEINTLVDCLLEVHRPRAAFNAVHMDFDKVETKRLETLLRAVAISSTEPAGRFQFSQYEVSQAFKSLAARNDSPRDKLIQLEFMYIDALDHSDYGIPSLECELSSSPQLFMQLIAMICRRKDDGEDPAEWRIPDEERRRAVANSAYSVLRRVKRVPGTNDQGEIDPVALCKWITETSALGRTYGRGEIVDEKIGELLGRSLPGPDGGWPCDAVCQALDSLASQRIAEGLSIGRRNSRGVYCRGDGGDDERAIAAQYRAWSNAVRFQYPFTARCLEDLARTYDREGVWHDTEANVRKRLGY